MSGNEKERISEEIENDSPSLVCLFNQIIILFLLFHKLEDLKGNIFKNKHKDVCGIVRED